MKTRLLYVLVTLFYAALADAAEDSMFKLSGIAALGVTHSTERNADYTSGIDHPNGAGATRANDFWGDTRVAVQVDGKFSDQLSAMLQVTSEHRYNNSFVPHVTASALKWQATPDVGLRIGRQPFLVFLVPEEKLPWVRATTEIYQSGLLNLYDGAELSAKTHWGETTFTAQGYVGAIQYPIPGGTDIRLTNLAGLNLLASVGHHTLRISRIRGRLTLHSPSTDGAFALLRTQPGGNALATQYQAQDAPTEHRSIAYCYHSEAGYLLAEWSQFTTGNSFVADSTQGHITTGIHLGQFTPFATLAGKQAGKIATDPNPILNALFANRAVGQKSMVVGLRWNLMTNTDVKMQYDYVINSAGSIGSLSNLQPNFLPGGRYRLASAALEYTF
jgi:hypothetical protein